MEITPQEHRTSEKIKPSSEKPKSILSPQEHNLLTDLRQLHEVRSDLKKEKNGESEKPKSQKTDGFEPFVNPEPTNDPLLINGYNGNFAQRMDLNRKVAERVLKIAHLDGKVVFTSFVASKKPSAEAQGEELVAKRNLFFGEKIEDENKDNPYHRVIPTPEGWRIEINDTRIMKELEEKKLTGKELESKFIQEFNVHLGQGLWDCIWREKLTTVKDKRLIRKTIVGFIAQAPLFLMATSKLLAPELPAYWYTFVGIGLLDQILYNSIPQVRKIDALWELLMPSVEIDKVGRSLAHLFFKGNTLAREKKEEK